jgi:beta-galactosidase
MSGPLGTADVQIWAERVMPQAADVMPLYTYGQADGWLDGAAGVVTRPVGKGRITYVGAWLDEAAMAKLLVWAAGTANIAPAWKGIPEGVEVNARTGGKATVYTMINWSAGPAEVALPRPMRDLLKDAAVSTVSLPRFGVAVLKDTP